MEVNRLLISNGFNLEFVEDFKIPPTILWICKSQKNEKKNLSLGFLRKKNQSLYELCGCGAESYIGSSSPFSNGLKKYEIDCSVTSSSRAGFQFGLLSFRTSAALTPAKRPQTLVIL